MTTFTQPLRDEHRELLPQLEQAAIALKAMELPA